MTAIQKAEHLAKGLSLTRLEIGEDKEKIIEALKKIKNNCNIVIRQLKNF